jgi:DNA-binding FadR family transcriptional regulator
VLGVTETLPQRVVAALNRDIESGELAPGSRLPTEQQLANRLGVSRNVVREAIAQLYKNSNHLTVAARG